MPTVAKLATPPPPAPFAEGRPAPEFGDPEALHGRFTIRSLFLDEVKSSLGRMLSRRRITASSPLLHVGCGQRVTRGFENLDFYTLKPSALKLPVRRRDLRFPLPYADASFTGAFTEHVLEHLFAHEVVSLVGEMHRVLKPGGILRVTVPDLGKYIRFYSGDSVSPEFQRNFQSGCHAIWTLTQCWGHVSCWDAATMIRVLLDGGFSSATEVTFGKGANAEIILDDPLKAWETLYVEAVR